MGVLALVKLHGLGNDFLACLDGEALDAAAGELAVSQSGLDRVAGLAGTVRSPLWYRGRRSSRATGPRLGRGCPNGAAQR